MVLRGGECGDSPTTLTPGVTRPTLPAVNSFYMYIHQACRSASSSVRFSFWLYLVLSSTTVTPALSVDDTSSLLHLAISYDPPSWVFHLLLVSHYSLLRGCLLPLLVTPLSRRPEVRVRSHLHRPSVPCHGTVDGHAFP